MIMVTRLGCVTTNRVGLPPIRSHDPSVRMSIKTTWKTENMSTIRVPMATKFDRMVNYLEGFLHIKLLDP